MWEWSRFFDFVATKLVLSWAESLLQNYAFSWRGPYEFIMHNHAILTLILVILSARRVAAVTCLSCHDGVPGCTGGATCPFYVNAFQNAVVVATGTHHATDGTIVTALAVASILPRSLAKFLSRGVLDFFKTVARRPGVGAAQDVTDLPLDALIGAVKAGTVEVPEALLELSNRLVGATAAEVTAPLYVISSSPP